METILDVQGLTVALPEDADRPYAVENVDLKVGTGEIVCVVGESGSGKSVTAQTVMGLLPKKQLQPVAGTVMLQGQNILDLSERQLRRLRGEAMAMYMSAAVMMRTSSGISSPFKPSG